MGGVRLPKGDLRMDGEPEDGRRPAVNGIIVSAAIRRVFVAIRLVKERRWIDSSTLGTSLKWNGMEEKKLQLSLHHQQ